MSALHRGLSVACLLTIGCASGGFEGGTYRPMQEDFDKRRLDHALVIDGMLRDYKARTGHFPLAPESDSVAVSVLIGTREQLETDGDRVRIFIDQNTRAANGVPAPAPASVSKRSHNDLVAALGIVLGPNANLPTDPQRVPVNKTNLYVYTVYRGVADISVFIHHELPFARRLGEYNNKVTVSSVGWAQMSIWTADELKGRQDFRAFFLAPFNRGGYELRTTIETTPAAVPQDQAALDRQRQADVDGIAKIIFEYRRASGKWPLSSEAGTRGFLVLIGHSTEDEDRFAEVPALKRGSLWSNAVTLERELSRTLGREVRLPRDPQVTPTFAPNVYLYFVIGDEFCVAAHLAAPSEKSVPYTWTGGTFHSHADCYKPDRPPARP